MIISYMWHATKWYYIPAMLIGFFWSLPNYNFKLFPKFRRAEKGFQIYSRNVLNEEEMYDRR